MTRYDVFPENQAAWSRWVRSYRALLVFAFVVMAFLIFIFGVEYFSGAFTVLRTVPGAWIYLLGLFAGLGITLVAVAYLAIWVYRSGPRAVEITPDGIVFEFTGKSRIRLRWNHPGFRLRISRVEIAGVSSRRADRVSVTVDGLRYPHIELNDAALRGILETARIHRMRVEENESTMFGNVLWRRFLIRSSPSGKGYAPPHAD